MGDLYSVLGVARSADATAIRHAYRTLARLSHPDLGGDERIMIGINQAWQVLGAPDRRARYDLELDGRMASTPDPVVTPRERRGGSTVLDFGRFDGWSLGEVAAADDDYLAWLARTPLGRPLRAEITQLLDERARAFEARRPVATATRARSRRRR